jgi:uncharacterized delta-60 repeat protein
LKPDGQLDTNFAWYPHGLIAFARQPDGRIIVAGVLESTQGVSRITRLLNSGVVDPTFDRSVGLNGTLSCLALQEDGKVIVAGDFSSAGAIARNGIARLHADGTLDLGFNGGPEAQTNITAMVVQADGKIYVAGSFTNFAGVPRNRIARLLPNGSLDTSFDPGTGANGQIRAMRLDPFGRIYIAGDFTRYNGYVRQRVARIHGDVFAVQPTFSGHAFSVRVMTAGGWTYHLDRSLAAQVGAWSEVANAPGDGTPITLSDPNPIEGSFYRVRAD